MGIALGELGLDVVEGDLVFGDGEEDGRRILGALTLAAGSHGGRRSGPRRRTKQDDLHVACCVG